MLMEGGFYYMFEKTFLLSFSKLHKNTSFRNNNIEAMFVEINLRKKKWLLSCSYNPHKSEIMDHLNEIGKHLDSYSSKYDNYIYWGTLMPNQLSMQWQNLCKLIV